MGKKAETGDTFIAAFNYPTASGANKNATNTFLWDYYYSKNTQKDANADTYQTYYSSTRSLENYPLLANGTPYIIGFPGKTFYEFDLSGQWTPKNTAADAPAPAQLVPQMITFASYPSNEDGFPVLSIGVSDTEQAEQEAINGYAFKPNYSTKVVAGISYQMVAAGDKFDKQTNATPVPFRPYFVAGSSSAPSTRAVQYIVFDNDDSSFAIGDEDPSKGNVGGLLFGTRRHTIIVTSSLNREADVRIVNTAGQTIDAYTIQPGETVETRVNNSAVYIIHAAGGHYTKKVTVK